MAMLMAGCGSSPEAAPKEPNSKVDAGTSAPSPQPSSTLKASFGQVAGWIAYSSRDGIWAVDPARPERRSRLSHATGDPVAWSSDGSKLLIWRESRSGAVSGRRISCVRRGRHRDPPDERSSFRHRRLLLTGRFRGRLHHGPFPGFSDLRGELRRGAPRLILRATRRVSIEGPRVLTDVYQPALSPDGTQIGYFDGMGDHSHNLWVMNADGTERRLLLDHEVRRPGHMYALTWSPDGEWLAFRPTTASTWFGPTARGSGRWSGIGILTASAVQWSPDGSRIAYLRGARCPS